MSTSFVYFGIVQSISIGFSFDSAVSAIYFASFDLIISNE
jgi:hypothetical protein